jgi:hypothetical protein
VTERDLRGNFLRLCATTVPTFSGTLTNWYELKRRVFRMMMMMMMMKWVCERRERLTWSVFVVDDDFLFLCDSSEKVI